MSAFPTSSRTSKLGCEPRTVCNTTTQIPWTTPQQILLLNSNGTTINVNFNAGNLSERLDALDFAFNTTLEENGYVITGIQFDIRRKLEFTGAIGTSRVMDYSVELIMNNTNVITSNRCVIRNNGTTTNGTNSTMAEGCHSWPNTTNTWHTVSYGGPDDLWGLTALDQETIETTDFGIGIRIRAPINNTVVFRNLSIDSISMTIYYSIPADVPPEDSKEWVTILLIATGSIIGGVALIIGIIFLIGFARRKMSMEKLRDPGNIRLTKQASSASLAEIYVTPSTRAPSISPPETTSSHPSFVNPSATPYPQVASYGSHVTMNHSNSSIFIPGKSSTPDVANYAKWPQKGDSKVCFGVPMDHVRKSQGIPIVIEECISFLENRALREEGILRLAGSSDEVNALKQTYNGGESPDFSRINDPNAVAGCLKLFFRDLPNQQKPLLMTTGIRSITNASEDQVIEILRNEMAAIPDLNQKVLKRLFGYLYAVSENVDANRMTPNNIAIVFGPTLALNVPVLEIIITSTPHIF